jgi:pSer/pThr/pTyr-binding forkhead associated (FHA) protein
VRRASPATALVARSDSRSYKLDHSPVTIGRALDNDIIIDDQRVSRHHATITLSGKAVSVTDLGSANGTAVNGLPVTTGRLEDGDTLSVGGVELRLRRPSP